MKPLLSLTLVLLVLLTACTLSVPEEERTMISKGTHEEVEKTIAQEGTLEVAALILQAPQASNDALMMALAQVMNDHPSTDLIVTPEYLYYGAHFNGISYQDDPLIIDCSRTPCQAQSTGTNKSDFLLETVQEVQKFSQEQEVNILLGTVAEQVITGNIVYTADSQIIIDKEGTIQGVYRKADVAHSQLFHCATHLQECAQAQEENLKTAKEWTLSTQEGKQFTFLPHVCGDKVFTPYLDKVEGSQARLIVGSDFDIDFNYREITEDIQSGEKPLTEGNFAQEGARYLGAIYADQWIKKRITTENAYFLVAEGFQPTAGLFTLNQEIIDTVEITDTYVYGIIPLANLQ